MKKAIKTSLLAAAVVASFGASATLTVSTTAQNVGVEGTATGTFVNLNAVTATATANASYSSMGGMKITLTGGSFNAGTSFVSAGSLTVGGTALAFGTDYSVAYNTDATEATVTFLNTTAVGTARTNMAAGNSIVVAANVIKVNSSAIAAKSKTEVAISPFSNVGGQTIETAKATALNGITQLGSKVTKFAEKIDVGQDKMYFATASKDASTTTTVELNSAAVGVNAVGTGTGQATVTLKGDFTFLDADNDGKLDTGTSISATGTTTVAKDLKSVSTKITPSFGAVGGSAVAASTTVTFTITTDGKREIPVQDFTVDAAYNYTGAGTVAGAFALENASAGSWTLNGSSPRIPYMPFGSGISQIVYVTNNGKVDGAVSFTAYDEAGTKYTGTLDVVAKANAVTQLSQALRQGLDAAGFSGTGKLKIDLTINAPSGDLQVFAAYNVRGDRLAVGIF